MPERINAVKTTFFGKGAIKLLGPELVKTGIKRALLITDRFLYESGLCQKVADVLSESGIEYAVYYDVKPNPSVYVVNDCIAAAKAIDARVLIALGGGSAIDTAKAVSIVLANGGRVEQYEGVNKSQKAGLPLVAINTTAGTGSECTTFYIVTDPVRQSKMAMVDTNCMVAIAVNDTDFMSSMPPKLTAATGMDALTHSIEAVFSKDATPITDKDAVWAIDAIVKNLPAAVRNGADEKARTMMAYAENVAGMAFSNAGLGMVHAMAHALGGHYNLAHGVCNAVLLPYVLSFDMKKGGFEERFEVVARAMGLKYDGRCSSCGGGSGRGTGAGLSAAEAVVNAIIAMNAEIGISPALKDLGKVRPEDFKELTALAMHDTCMTTNLVPVTAEEVTNVYAAAYYGKL
ncbi:MAG: iron-containing alcohol dehydrogenase [Eubacteriales bacterium]|nr:iron-containing alcohol dehydrogenase [Eubacteriales bacterium]